MDVTYDPPKRASTLASRGLDFDDAKQVFAGATWEIEDTRKDYGESRHVFSMRKANEREKKRFGAYLEI